MSGRQVRRLQRRYEDEGAAGRVSQRQSKPSNRRLGESTKGEILARVRECYPDFSPTLAAEYLRGEGFRVSKEILRL